MADGSLFAKPWKAPDRERCRRLWLLVRLHRMRGRAPHASEENGRAHARWHARIQKLEALARTMRGFNG